MNTQITTATNLVGPDTSVSQNDARKYFNNFYSEPFEIGPADDAIVGFFEQYTGNKKSAKNLAAVVVYTAKAQNIDPMLVLSEFQSMPRGQLNSYLAAFLNTNRAPTSSIGIKVTNNTNPLVARTVLL
jgi:hypothetical protein